MSVVFSVSGTFNRNPPNFAAGESITGTIVGDATNTTADTVETWGPVDVPVKSASGAQSSVSLSAFQVSRPGAAVTENVTIDQSRPITGIGTRTAVYSADGKSFTVVA